MKKTHKTGKPVAPETIARLADQGKDISKFFKGEGRMIQPIHRVNVDLTLGMLLELDQRAARLNISRQAVIKTLLDRALQQERVSKPRASRKAS
jgi:hypothetical protein